MNVTLIYVSNMKTDFEHLGIAMIASYLRKYQINVTLHGISVFTDVKKALKNISLDDDLYGFPMYETNALYIYEIAEEIKKHNPNSKIFSGGFFATACAPHVLDDCPSMDFVVLGEGETPVLEAVRALSEKKEIKHEAIFMRGDKLSEKLPFVSNSFYACLPARDNLNLSIKNGLYSARIIAGKGCCGDCTFCSFNNYTKINKSKVWLGREMKDVFDEIVSLYETFGIRSFAFSDGSLEDPGTLGKERLTELCKLLIDYDVKFHFWCFLRAETFDESDIPLMKLMKEAGIYNVNIGVDAANDKDLALYKKRATLAENNRAVEIFRKNDLDVTIGLIMFNPYSTRDTLRQNYEFLSGQKIETVFLYTTILSAYMGTQIYDKVNSDNLLKSTYLEPSVYDFVDKFAAEANDFFMRTFRKSPCALREYEFTSLWYFVSSLLRYFPEEASPYFEEIKILREQIATESKQYFKIIYVDNDLKYAEECFLDFENRILEIYTKISNVKIRMLKREPFRSYYLRNNL
ncbi:MAG: hypothetical protein RHS_1240 [Robinsoniella sp. RHS]|uniref:B12-binding domain-containing radical SAM protein n=1 Tax=Robinsoniella sp. RHS TaxID=1504536 RepID=UPI00064A0A48|nr:MAG: hypothetical protein RHS_1240 [Robinsoniella sp. RHS]